MPPCRHPAQGHGVSRSFCWLVEICGVAGVLDCASKLSCILQLVSAKSTEVQGLRVSVLAPQLHCDLLSFLQLHGENASPPSRGATGLLTTAMACSSRGKASECSSNQKTAQHQTRVLLAVIEGPMGIHERFVLRTIVILQIKLLE